MPFILLAISLLFTLRGNYYTAPPQKGGFSGPLSCQPNLETNQIIHVDIAPEKEYMSNGSPLYLDKEGKEWALIKRQAPIPAWKIWGGMIKTREGLRLGEMEEIGKTTPPAAFNPDTLGKRVFIGLGHCDGTPGQTCIDPIVQNTLFVAIKETYQSWNEIPPQAQPKCEQTDPITKKCSKMSWGDPEFEGYWWEFNIYLDKSLLPDPATNDDLPCWTRIACAGDIIVDGGKRRKAMMDEYLRTGVCPVGTDPKTSTAKALSFDSLGWGEFQTAASPPTPTPTATVIAPQGGKSLKLGTFYPSKGFNYEWWTPACKPAIYLYPEEPTELIVKVKPQGRITESIPEHGEDGWQVVAYPDGTIRQWSEGKGEEAGLENRVRVKKPVWKLGEEVSKENTNFLTSKPNRPPNPNPTAYPYLYYEAELEKVKVPEEGWLVEKDNLENFFTTILPQLGLNEKESLDFLDYWLPKLNSYLSDKRLNLKEVQPPKQSSSPKLFVGLIAEEELNRVEPIEISPKPDTFIRVRFYFERLIDKTIERYNDIKIEENIAISPARRSLVADAPKPLWRRRGEGGQYRNNKPRRGFVAVDWGGILANGSCGLNEKSE